MDIKDIEQRIHQLQNKKAYGEIFKIIHYGRYDYTSTKINVLFNLRDINEIDINKIVNILSKYENNNVLL